MKIKTIIKIVIFLIGSSTLMSCATNRSAAGYEVSERGDPGVSYDVFYNALSPYGRWITYPQYGQVWVPNVSHGFRPYGTNGHWVYSTYGWTWVSNYRWGWAPFHYGRWAYDNFYGWIWVPGNVWGPAWVAWRSSPQFYGWAPLGPGMQFGRNYGNIPSSYWVFVPSQYITNRHIYRYYKPSQQNGRLIQTTHTIYNNQNYPVGPTRTAVQQATNESVRPVRVFNSGKPENTRLSDNRLHIYRPRVTEEEGNASGRRPENTENNRRPQRVFNPDNARERAENTRPRRRTSENNRRQTAPQQRSNRNVRPQQNQRPTRVFRDRPSNQNNRARPQRRVSSPQENHSTETNRSSSSRPQRR